MHDRKNLFEPNEWCGEFFYPDQYDSRFGGKLTYSANKGVRLSYLIPGFKQITPAESLDGILEDGWRCSLIGTLADEHAGFAEHGKFMSRSGSTPFYFLVRGGFWKPDDLVRVLTFSVTGLQEFFFPKGHKDNVKFEPGPRQIGALPFGVLEIYQRASFGILPRDITSQIFHRDKAALEDLVAAIDGVYARHSPIGFMSRKDISYYLQLTLNEPNTLQEAYRYVKETADLLAVLLYRPCHPEWLQISDERDGSKGSELIVFPSLCLNNATVDLCMKDVSHFNLPITAGNVNLSQLICKWFSLPERYGTVVTSLQHEVGFRTDHTLWGDVVLHASQLEAIAAIAGRHRDKYTYPLEQHASFELTERLKVLFEARSIADVGAGIADLRNEIAHIERKKILVSRLTSKGVLCVARCLELVVIGSVLDQIGVSESIRSGYQNMCIL